MSSCARRCYCDGGSPMTQVFDDAYAKYLSSLAKLDSTHDISEKNRLFRQLTEQLAELENRINNGETTAQEEDTHDGENNEPT
jgi:hypothetical protein